MRGAWIHLHNCEYKIKFQEGLLLSEIVSEMCAGVCKLSPGHDAVTV